MKNNKEAQAEKLFKLRLEFATEKDRIEQENKKVSETKKKLVLSWSDAARDPRFEFKDGEGFRNWYRRYKEKHGLLQPPSGIQSSNVQASNPSTLDEFMTEVRDLLHKEYEPIRIRSTNKKQNLTACVVLSDWHVDELVRPETIHDLNSFNIDIAKQRAEKCFDNSVHLINKEDNIDNLLLCLAGDFISGYIHPELIESNTMSPTRGTWKCYEFLRSGIDHILNNTSVSIKIPCVVGNHSRLSEKKKVSTAVDNSFEWLMYKMLEKDYIGNDRVQFDIAAGKILYLRVYDYIIRLTHGDQIRGGQGVGGVAVPVLRKIAKWDLSKTADLTIIGHFHQAVTYKNAIINASLVGYNAFAEEIGASFEDPSQTFFIIDQEYGRTTTCPIFLT